ncbi:MAG: hypothetical protein ACFE0Q_12895 [Anaerolineae bacterium]
MPAIKDIILASLASLMLGLIGAIPFAILGLIFGGADTARDIYLLEMLVIASWLPLKIMMDQQVKGESVFRLPQISLNQLSLFIVLFASLVLMPVMYVMTIIPFLIGALVYALFNSLPIAILTALIVQGINLYQGAVREKAMGSNNQFFVRMQDFSQGGFDFQIDPDQVRQQTPREDDAPVLYLPEDSLRDRNADDDRHADEPPITITIPPDSLTDTDDDTR